MGPLIATGSCIVDQSSCGLACPSGYVQDGNKCVWSGSPEVVTGSSCLPGTTYDPQTQCCSANPGIANSIPLCPAGTYPLDGVCVGSPTGELSTVNENVIFNSCEPPKNNPGDDPGDDTPGGGEPTPVACNLSPTSCVWGFDARKCCCTEKFDPNSCED